MIPCSTAAINRSISTSEIASGGRTTISELRKHPEGVDLGPLRPTLPERLKTRDKRIDLLVDDKEIARRLSTLKPAQAPRRGYAALYQNSVTQAPLGCDFDFLAGK